MPDITDNEPASMKRLHPFRPVVTARGCLFCRHQVDDHTGTALGVRLEGREYRRYVLCAAFCHACSAEKATEQVTCWQMPERVYVNFSRYGVEVGKAARAG